MTKVFLCSNSKNPFPLIALLHGIASIPRQRRGKTLPPDQIPSLKFL
ncbi:hypothetical protein NC653_028575 [Populus alba x Populus x berolinensis]|uniref:Uncharacterized protein n=1 Tax=Populus alba x Populus x berolinensis TaxID=444605 RepID=A0AAD6Q291_9ROSI|nr:hypothetical protein NC653_028575 [Populus alba x Populus x berolinensis]